MTSTGAPPPRQKQEALQSSQAKLFEFEFPQNTAGMAKLKKRQSGVRPSIAVHPILPKPSSSVCHQSVRFPMVLIPSVAPQPVSVASSQVERPSITHQVVRFPVALTPTVAPQSVSAGSSQTDRPSTSQGKKRKLETSEGVEKRKYTKTATTIKCSMCGNERNPPGHQQYMGHRYCVKTETMPFEEWRAQMQAKGVARKRKL